jgi:Caspase domain
MTVDGFAPGVVARADTDLTGPELQELRPHVVNLSKGAFSQSGDFATSPADVDAIFAEHLPAFVAARGSRPVPLVIWAHGGMVNEQGGLRIAYDQSRWWRDNGAYPLHFVWESGLFEILGQYLLGRRVARGWVTELSDAAIEEAIGTPGGLVWLGMKNSAALASAGGGGAAYVAAKLAEFCAANPGMIELHAVGHSAGSIFHSHFVPAALAAGAPPFETVQLLAPAIRLDAFTSTLKPHVPDRIRRMTVFTMTRDFELDDNTLVVYRKSLLYLISRGLEIPDNAPLLGLQESLTNDSQAAAFFGLTGTGAGKAQVIWSPTRLEDGGPRGASGSTSHGGFDNDELTMNSVARRVLGRDGIVSFPPATRSRAARVWDAASAPGLAIAARPATPALLSGPRDGRRSALCVGINAYAGANELFACVADAEAWARALARRGFTTDLVTDRDATRDGILGRLTDMVGSARPGDVLAFQFAGHGVEVPDEDGDEAGGSNGLLDEAFCPVDADEGRLILDDEIFQLLRTLPSGVSFTSFFDCCHSGTMSRTFSRRAALPGAEALPAGLAGAGRKTRFMKRSRELVQRHRAFARLVRQGLTSGVRGPAGMNDVCFSACLPEEEALESDGHGHFTLLALRMLEPELTDLSNEDFLARVVELFGPASARQQTPTLDCRAELRGSPLLSALTMRAPVAIQAGTTPRRAAAAGLLRAAADVIETD